MGKHLVYIAGAITIIIIFCSVTAITTKGNSNTSSKPVVTNTINDIHINDDAKTTTNIWDYLNSQKDTIGSSSNDTKSNNDEPALTIVLK